MRLSQFEVIEDEQKFVDVNEARSRGRPESRETQQAILRLAKYKEAKSETIPPEIIQSINNTVYGIQDQ